jgi:hypothetical protein
LEDDLRYLNALLLGTALIATMAGCGGGGGGGGGGVVIDKTPPAITATSAASPATSDGGPVLISANVTDAGGVKEVYALVTRPDGGSDRVNMFLTTRSTYQGTYTSPPNLDLTPAVYIVIVTAGDNSDNFGSSFPFNFEVPASEFPPPPPDTP